MTQIRVFGSSYSVYVRSVQLALIEKGVAYDLIPIDVFAPEGPPPGYLVRQPFARIPAFEHGTFRLYETGAILRYVDEALPGPPLQPGAPSDRARVNQILSIADSYVYPTLVWGVHAERVAKPRRGIPANEARIAAALAKSVTCLDALAGLKGDAPWLAGGALTLADLHIAPMLHYFLQTEDGRALFGRYPGLLGWWARIDARDSLRITRPSA
jgi:glutathione S-transferase